MPKVNKARKLTDLQIAFCHEYVIDFNGTQAAIRAGYKPSNAQSNASRQLSDPRVQELVAELMEKRTERTKVDADWMLKRLVAEAEADIADLYDEEGGLKPVHQWPKIWRTGLVAGIEVEEIFEGTGKEREHVGQVKKLKLSDRIKRLDLIGKHVDVQAFKERRQLEADEPLRQLMAQITGRSIRPSDDEEDDGA